MSEETNEKGHFRRYKLEKAMRTDSKRSMQLLWLVLGLVAVGQSAVPDGPRREGSKQLAKAADCNGVVAFSATSSPSSAKSGKNQIINFETPLIDKSIGYSRESGIFTAYCPGLYQFSFSATGENARFSLRKRPSSTTTSWTSIVTTGKPAGGHVVFLDMEVGEQAAVFLDNGSLSPSPSHSFSGFRVSKK